MTSSIPYRPEIDGLRAIAVLLVVLFHADFQWIQGGFIGVDVFFVISGFLITSILMRFLDQGTFSLLDFYERRIRRILPALFLVIIFTFIVGVIFLLPYELRDLSKSIVATLLFGANLFFWRTNNYFAAEADEKPMLHMWSLGVEEQFYIVFPFLLMGLYIVHKKHITILLFLLAIISFAFSQWLLFLGQTTANFYLPFSRAWELLIGCLCAAMITQKSFSSHIPRILSEILCFTGLVLILFSSVVFSSETPFPGFYALIPTLGTALILLSSKPSYFIARLLSFKPLVILGLLSYSFYLWHHVLFAYARIISLENLSYLNYGALILASLALSYCSWKWFECPLRNRAVFKRSQVFVLAVFTTGFLGLCAVSIWASNGLEFRYNSVEQRLLNQTDIVKNASYVTRFFDNQKSEFSSVDHHKTFLVGDSHAQDFANIMNEVNAFDQTELATFYIPSRCFIYLGDDYSKHQSNIAHKDLALCQKNGNLKKSIPTIKQANTIIIANSWREWSVENLGVTLRNIYDLNPDVTLWVVGRKEFKKILPRKILKEDPDTWSTVKGELSPYQKTIQTKMQKVLPEASFINIQEQYCKKSICRIFTPQNDVISYDGGHLTQKGSIYLGQKLQYAYPELFVSLKQNRNP